MEKKQLIKCIRMNSLSIYELSTGTYIIQLGYYNIILWTRKEEEFYIFKLNLQQSIVTTRYNSLQHSVESCYNVLSRFR